MGGNTGEIQLGPERTVQVHYAGTSAVEFLTTVCIYMSVWAILYDVRVFCVLVTDYTTSGGACVGMSSGRVGQ